MKAPFLKGVDQIIFILFGIVIPALSKISFEAFFAFNMTSSCDKWGKWFYIHILWIIWLQYKKQEKPPYVIDEKTCIFS